MVCGESYCTLFLSRGVCSLVMVLAFNSWLGTDVIVIYVIIIIQHNGISDLKNCVIMSE